MLTFNQDNTIGLNKLHTHKLLGRDYFGKRDLFTVNPAEQGLKGNIA